jgi:hypothetical protein
MFRLPANRSWAHLALLFCLGLASLWLLVGCKMPAPLPAQPTTGQSTSTLISGTQITEEAGNSLLPQALYFLRQDANGLPQVWRLSPDGKALVQLTFSTTPVRDFDISLPGRLAYVGGGSLVVYSLINSTSKTWWDSPEYQPDTYPHAPRWSPDGETLAYASDGVWLRRGEDIRLLYPDPVDSGQRTFPYSWSPDGHWLLVSQDREQGTTLAVLEANTGKLVQLANAPLCCQAAWTPDSQGLFVANPYPQQGPSGLWWASINNLAAPLLPWQAEDGTYNVVGWPHINQNGLLGYAFANFPATPPDSFPFGLYTANLSSPDQRQALRLETFFLREIIWTPDGRRALLVIPAPGSAASQVAGPVVLVSAGQQPGLVLSDSGYNLRWGP